MSGMYGTVKPADLNINDDVEMFYHYRPSLNSDDTDFTNFKELSTSLLQENKCNGVSISGLFNLKLPLNVFNKKGIYTIYIRPKEISATISDVGVLLGYPDIRGVIFNKENLPNFESNNSLIGYRIEYLDNEGKKTGDFKIITSSNLASAILDTSSKLSYQLTSTGNLIFCTVTPSLAPTFNPTNLPNIGKNNDSVKIINTKFNPIMIEIEMVEHDAETISYILEGDQLVDKDRGIITTFNHNGEIYHQSEYGTYKDEYGAPLYEYKRSTFDSTQTFDNLDKLT